MKLHKQLKWLGPYLEAVSHMVPISKLTSITLRFWGDKLPNEKALYTEYDDGSASILIRMPIGIKDKIPLDYWAQEEILCHLAHELSHLSFIEHIPERFLLETLIYHQFAVVLTRLEYEVKRNRAR